MSETTLTPNSTRPTGSSWSGLPDGCRVTGSNQMARAIAARESGTLIQKMPRQPSSGPPIAIMSPPRVGPNAVASADRRAEQAERLAPLLALEELLDEAEHLRHLDARRDALQETGDEQHGRIRREGGDEAREREEAEADDEERLARALVADATSGHEREPEREHVARDDELQFGRARIEGVLDRRQADVDLREVHDRQRRHRDADPVRTPAVLL